MLILLSNACNRNALLSNIHIFLEGCNFELDLVWGKALTKPSLLHLGGFQIQIGTRGKKQNTVHSLLIHKGSSMFSNKISDFKSLSRASGIEWN